MKTYNVLYHPTKGFAVVKSGFSWPVLFYGWIPFYLIIWMLWKKLYNNAAIWFFLYLIWAVFAIFGTAINLAEYPFFLFLIIFSYLSLWLGPAFRGNEWRYAEFVNNGYEKVDVITAGNYKEAITQLVEKQKVSQKLNHSEIERIKSNILQTVVFPKLSIVKNFIIAKVNNKASLALLLISGFILISYFVIIKEPSDKGIDQLVEIKERWDDGYKLASSTSRIALSGPVSILQSIKRDLKHIEVSRCLNDAKDHLDDHMEATINMFMAFMGQEEEQQYISGMLAQVYLMEYETKLNACIK
jgi:hypothetical protein